MFNTVMRNEVVARAVLSAIEGYDVGPTEDAVGEFEINEPGPSRGVRLDTRLRLTSGTVYDVELQRTDDGDLSERTTLYSARIVVSLLHEGQKFYELPGVNVVWICTFDPFKLGRASYTFRQRCDEEPELVLSEQYTTRFLCANNAERADSEALRDLLAYIASDRAEGELSRIIEEEVVRVRDDVRWREDHMSWESAIADERFEAREEGREEGQAQMAAVTRALLAAQRFEDLQMLSQLRGRELADAVTRYAEELGAQQG
ncbi:PD-(D/E)XK nuclease family transposase [Olsenella sp. YH-ols2217]|uniref:PD-(D/E)XK nuclease family transposase n=1 Tax=Kribbibacterium absianum TaxID=3044210 RepID=A0ABT6ZK24_9ACTN|nr:PD-(D/E)XK nuclease family transposase [Olsenella sp. YH-ols2217]MDJ1122721.1 PD-(D/E)XK nuclease family transposase [Olsenella sp. YH-ols2216]MDJ1129159.1 PD-(D/E)XK nuclease family transposase [Olsenella sp. YH-ols2217]